MKSNALGLFFGGLLPVIAFTVIEEYYGAMAGLIAGMLFGFGEIIFELFKYKKVQKITLIGNALLIGLGSVSLISAEGVWFKLQPAIMEAAFALILWISLILKKPLLVFLAEQQGHQLPEAIKSKMRGFTFRIGIFFAVHAALATWAALFWSTRDWAVLKGIGLTVSFILYMLLEGFLLRKSVRRDVKSDQAPYPDN